jgi:hypothetical protein
MATMAVALTASVAGCAVGPDFQRPHAPQNAGNSPTPLPETTVSAAVHGGEAQRLAIGKDIQFIGGRCSVQRP